MFVINLKGFGYLCKGLYVTFKYCWIFYHNWKSSCRLVNYLILHVFIGYLKPLVNFLIARSTKEASASEWLECVR